MGKKQLDGPLEDWCSHWTRWSALIWIHPVGFVQMIFYYFNENDCFYRNWTTNSELPETSVTLTSWFLDLYCKITFLIHNVHFRGRITLLSLFCQSKNVVSGNKYISIYILFSTFIHFLNFLCITILWHNLNLI